ncbi:hypothetical protein SAMN05444360_11458 [Chryseobacterium carnipullorum]|uniref:hypothetical protein n=1 Tax=Chryseobacterium carnipullorum TaxID=1124835 RepID=UPI00091D575A|nr:hypothetical protein [Chryseobacterium carnipullorum]SHM59166.1 hypothetical protein SAMN05444360_11458 [Chryseobacterium carnipullorum]
MNNNSIDERSNRRLILVLFILSFILLFLSVKYSLFKLPSTKSITEIKGILKETEINKGRRGSKSLTIKLNEYPEINFMIGTIAIKQTYLQEFMNENKSGDSIVLFIENKEYKRKILKSEKIPFPENYLYKDNIGIVEIHNKNTEYLSLNNYNKEHRDNNYLAIVFFGGFGLLMLFVGIKGVKYYNTNFR